MTTSPQLPSVARFGASKLTFAPANSANPASASNSRSPFQILTILLEQPGLVIPRQLRNASGPNTFVDFGTASTPPSTNSATPSPTRPTARFIETLPNDYPFIAPVSVGAVPRAHLHPVAPRSCANTFFSSDDLSPSSPLPFLRPLPLSSQPNRACLPTSRPPRCLLCAAHQRLVFFLA